MNEQIVDQFISRREMKPYSSLNDAGVQVFDVIRVANGVMVEHWGVPDRLGVLLQLGLVSPPTPAAAGA